MPKNVVYIGNLKNSEDSVLQYGCCLYGILKDNTFCELDMSWHAFDSF